MATRKTANTDAEQATPGFEESLAQLETLVSDMEDGNLSLEQALAAFETGIKLTRQCQQALQAAELKVQILTNPDGEPAPMRPDDSEGDEAEP